MQYATIDPAGNRCYSSLPYCGYSCDTLKSMADAGFSLEIDGKKAKFPTRAEYAEAVKAAGGKKPLSGR